jgi:hypothetical protein
VKSFLQFLLFVLLITLALAGLYSWKSDQFEEGRPPLSPDAAALPSVKPALSSASIPGLAALDEEFTKVAEAVVPSVVSVAAQPWIHAKNCCGSFSVWAVPRKWKVSRRGQA